MILAEAIRRTHNGESISYLFGHVPLWRSNYIFFTYSIYNSGPLDSFVKSISVDLFCKEVSSAMDSLRTSKRWFSDGIHHNLWQYSVSSVFWR